MERARQEEIARQEVGISRPVMDSAAFRLYCRGLVLVRPCACCGAGHFESPEITDLADLGYALPARRLLHGDHEEYSSEGLADL